MRGGEARAQEAWYKSIEDGATTHRVNELTSGSNEVRPLQSVSSRPAAAVPGHAGAAPIRRADRNHSVGIRRSRQCGGSRALVADARHDERC